MAKLIVVEGPDAGNEYELGEQANAYTAGRDPDNELALNDTAISRRHFRVERAADGWRVCDLGSRNQTFLNGHPIREAGLRHGDVLRVGDTEIRFEDHGLRLEEEGVVSTIIKELPAGLRQANVTARLERIERELREGDARERLRGLLGFLERVGASRSSRDVLDQLLGELVLAVGADRAAIIVREGSDLVALASRSGSGDTRAEGIRASTSVISRVLEEGAAILSANTTSDERFRGKESIVSQEIASVVAAPLRAGGKTIGALYADRRGGREAFTEGDLEFLAGAAGPTGSWLERAREEDDLRRENRTLYRSIAQTRRIIGQSKAIVGVLDFIRRAAPTPMTVLIEGETGTGKELVASAVHYSSPRKGCPFVTINCAALPENLVESELFGHERGAFTGAITRRKGKFELGDTGTVFLDEVGELTLPCQAKLLRLLEDKVFERVGGAEPVRVDVRIIAATNKDLLTAVSAGTFREDLYYRLNVLTVHLPPLRERPEDIPLLADHFLRECCGGTKRISPAAERKLLSHPWPGNARQLRNVIESAVVLGDAEEIRPEDLVLPEETARGRGGNGSQAEAPWKPMSLQELERIHIQRVLEHTGGNKKRAAEILGIERCTLYSKIKSYGM